eukprot:m.232247 g.232247  ORF g.232247 m.232247 type:complete len:673 (-) comp33617_c0_seq1:29-2047(-)
MNRIRCALQLRVSQRQTGPLHRYTQYICQLQTLTMSTTATPATLRHRDKRSKKNGDQASSTHTHSYATTTTTETTVTESRSPKSSMPACRLRIFQFNDVYLLDNLAKVKTCVDKLSQGFPRSNVLTVLPGDFLAPSLLSGIDHGRGMVNVLNQIPVDIVCFGNHEADVPYLSLVDRIAEFKGVWLNSNMRTFEPACPDNHVIELDGGRKVGFVGLNIGGGKDTTLYRKNAFNGAKITPVLEAVGDAVARLTAEHGDLDTVIPLTHQDVKDDRKLAATGHGFSVILGAHNHFEVHEVVDNTLILKAGQDANKVIVLDVVWEEGTPAQSPPSSVSCFFEVINQDVDLKHGVSKDLQQNHHFEANVDMQANVDRWLKPVVELQEATILKVKDGSISSIGPRLHESTMATLIATALRKVTQVDIALVNGGGIRANKKYGTHITFADLNTECPFPSPFLVVPVDGKTLSEAIQFSRRKWILNPPEEDGGAFHFDDKSVCDPKTGQLLVIRGKPLEPQKTYECLIDSYMLSYNKVFAKFKNENEDLIPPPESGLPMLPLLLEQFSFQAWRNVLLPTNLVPIETGETKLNSGVSLTLSDINTFFDTWDNDASDTIDKTELAQAFLKRLGPEFSNNSLVTQCINAAASTPGATTVSRSDIKRFFSRKLSKVPLDEDEDRT